MLCLRAGFLGAVVREGGHETGERPGGLPPGKRLVVCMYICMSLRSWLNGCGQDGQAGKSTREVLHEAVVPSTEACTIRSATTAPIAVGAGEAKAGRYSIHTILPRHYRGSTRCALLALPALAGVYVEQLPVTDQ